MPKKKSEPLIDTGKSQGETIFITHKVLGEIEKHIVMQMSDTHDGASSVVTAFTLTR